MDAIQEMTLTIYLTLLMEDILIFREHFSEVGGGKRLR